MADEFSTYQYGRVFSLVVFGTDLDGLDLSELRCKFVTKRSNGMTPNTADIRVYNVMPETALRIKTEFKRVILQGGYESNFGVIFQGNIKQVIIGRESATDTFVDIVAGDGDLAYNYAIINATLAAGADQTEQVAAAAQSMTKKGVTLGHLSEMPTEKLPRGKVMFGNARNYLRNVAQNAEADWSIQDEKITYVSTKSYLPGEAVFLSAETGLIGTPQQTNQGVNMKCLLNPNIKIGGRVQVDNSKVEQFKLDFSVVRNATNTPAPLTADGVYFPMVVEHQGDTRGVEWYSSLICLTISVASNPANSVTP